MGVVHDIRDLLHERRIAGLSQRCQRAMRERNGPEAMRAWDELKAAILARSPEFVERMEQQQLKKLGVQ